MEENILNTIKSRGYWRINFRPLSKMENLELVQCKNLVEKNAVEFRGWYYPHFPRRNRNNAGLFAGNNYYQGWINSGAHKEIWRMYQSGQFIHYRSVEEDWVQEDGWYAGSEFAKVKPGAILSVINYVFLITEIYEFLLHLINSGLYDQGLKFDLRLIKTAKRKLVILDPRRAPLFDDYIAEIDDINFTAEYSREQIIQSSREEALKAIVFIFNRFGWENPPIAVFKNDQERLITRNF